MVFDTVLELLLSKNDYTTMRLIFISRVERPKTVLYCIVLYCIVLYCIVLYYIEFVAKRCLTHFHKQRLK